MKNLKLFGLLAACYLALAAISCSNSGVKEIVLVLSPLKVLVFCTVRPAAVLSVLP